MPLTAEQGALTDKARFFVAPTPARVSLLVTVVERDEKSGVRAKKQQ
ncbi:hypothetical protein JXA88_13735 [Candidatus Fermentibacteria bacterium]|nr:hypothetical protein [Candidatus Fermentibacteria bacterium]